VALAEAASPARSDTPSTGGAAIVSLRALTFGYQAESPVLRGVNLDARAGEITVVLGGSGSGKTTLLRLIAGLLRPTGGEVRVLGEDPVRGRLHPRVAYVPQQLGLTRARSALENVLVGALGHTSLLRSLLGGYGERDRVRALELLTSLGLEVKAHEPVHALSGGERQRVAIARALLQDPRVLLADEFVSHLDAVTSREVLEQVRRIAASGVSVIVTTHELDLALTFADRLVVMRGGTVVLDSPADGLDETALTAAIRK
jgi:phosphonate transport system ATP-binding protein